MKEVFIQLRLTVLKVFKWRFFSDIIGLPRPLMSTRFRILKFSFIIAITYRIARGLRISSATKNAKSVYSHAPNQRSENYICIITCVFFSDPINLPRLHLASDF